MKLHFLLLVCWARCSEQPDQSTTVNKVTARPATNSDSAKDYVWTKLLDSAEWKKSYNFEMYSVRDTLWVFHPDGNWFSPDGNQWTKSTLPNAIGNLAFLDYVEYGGAVYGIGHFEGNIENFSLKNEVYKTSDFHKWQTISTESNFPKRFFYHPFAFKNKLWIIGGEDKTTKYADVWNSSDGITWRKQKDNLPFGKRSGSQVVLLKGKLFLLDNDVWSSSDGLNWQKETDEIVKGENIFGYKAVVYDNKIWLIGCNRDGKFQSQVFVSDDGRNWQPQEAPWTPRGAVAAAVYKNKIYMTGGKYGGFPKGGKTTEFVYSNDVWALGPKE
jgi:hypothetical protein